MMKTSSLFFVSACLLAGTLAAQDTNLMLANGQQFINTPYVAHTLEVGEVENLVINCDEVDCTTLVEYVLAMSLCPTQGDAMLESDFANNLQRIRYRDGVINGYTSRLHYITDWVNNGVRNGFLEDVTAKNCPYSTPLSVSFMTTHPQKYKQLTNSPANVTQMKEYEKALSGQEIYWLPKDVLPVTGMPWIKNGDIIAITSATPGLDVAHIGIAIYINGNLTILHASSWQGTVLVEKLPLKSFLARNKNFAGIRVVRMKR